jgi:hypothetical protein
MKITIRLFTIDGLMLLLMVVCFIGILLVDTMFYKECGEGALLVGKRDSFSVKNLYISNGSSYVKVVIDNNRNERIVTVTLKPGERYYLDEPCTKGYISVTAVAVPMTLTDVFGAGD